MSLAQASTSNTSIATVPKTTNVSVDVGRPRVRGKFLVRNEQTFWVKGVTYGPFGPCGSPAEYGSVEQAANDFAQIAAHGFNTIRTYTVPPLWLLDLAQRNDLVVMIGLAWEQHVAFLSDNRRANDIERRIRDSVAAIARHPATLCYSVGNEIPASIARWYRPTQVERWIERLYRTAKSADPGGLVTYVNYPSTEYLNLPFLDLVCFNVYLERPGELEKYLARMQNLAGERPLVLAEIGLDRIRHGLNTQANHVDWQIRCAFAAGCAGAIVFSWTDEWHRGGLQICDWEFGLTDLQRRPRPALQKAARAMSESPFPGDRLAPPASVVVCTRNGARTIARCLQHLQNLDYPNFDVIVVDDGSTDTTPETVSRFDVRLIRSRHRGLSAARNIGLAAAQGKIVAYLDDDAYPDPHWLSFLVDAIERGGHVGAGGPNLLPPDDPTTAQVVARAPGGPTHVLTTDQTAEHIPGCNMAFRREALLEIGGFDEQFWIAGDDVDVCWRLLERGGTLGFSPSALVWHHRRNTVRGYWRQQVNYGRAEALLEVKWPHKYNALGHLIWRGRLYSNADQLSRRTRIRYGTWGTELFQPAEQPAAGGWGIRTIARMPEWYLVLTVLAALAIVGAFWPPLRWSLWPSVAAIVATIARAWIDARRALRDRPGKPLSICALTALHLIQPAARLWGRISGGLIPWRARGIRGVSRMCLPIPRQCAIWSENWKAPEDWLRELEGLMRKTGAAPVRGGRYDRWDLELNGGWLAAIRMLSAIEEHGQGRQLVRFKMWPRWNLNVLLATSCTAAGGGAIVFSQAGARAGFIVGTVLLGLGLLRAVWEAGAAMNAVRVAADALTRLWGCKVRNVAVAMPAVEEPTVTGECLVGK